MNPDTESKFYWMLWRVVLLAMLLWSIGLQFWRQGRSLDGHERRLQLIEDRLDIPIGGPSR